jgi:hypothetical protein
MVMNRIHKTMIMLGLVVLSAVSVEAAELVDPLDMTGREIVVVNDYTSTVRVFVQDADGTVHNLGRVVRGEVKQFTAPTEILERGNFRVRIHPVMRASWDGHTNIKTRSITVTDDEQVIMWLTADLEESTLEVVKE